MSSKLGKKRNWNGNCRSGIGIGIASHGIGIGIGIVNLSFAGIGIAESELTPTLMYNSVYITICLVYKQECLVNSLQTRKNGSKGVVTLLTLRFAG